MPRKPKKKGKKTSATPSATAIASRAGCSRQLASRLLARGMNESEIIARVAESKAREADLLELPPVNGHAANAGLTYSQAQAAKENALAELHQLKVMERRHELVPVAYVKLWAMRFLVEGRDVLLNGPGQLADQLAAESDPPVVEQILRGWVNRTLERYFQLETLWGGGEPLDDKVLRERFEAARLSVVVKRPVSSD
jgi:hypothetical protein